MNTLRPLRSMGIIGIIAAVLLLTTCGETGETTDAGTDSAVATLSPEATGIDFVNQLKPTSQLNIIEYLYYYNGGGVAIGDIDNDGREDLYFTANQGPDKLYRNLGELKFEDITAEAGIATDATWSSGVAMEDVNNDGFLDIYVSKVGVLAEAHNLLYINQGDGTFREMAEELGVAFQGFSTQAAFLDYDRDGDLDIYLLNHNIHSVRSYGAATKREEQDPYAGDRFFENRLNEAEGKFVDVTPDVGIYSSPLGYGLAITCADLDGNGWTDVYVGNDFHENDYLYLNQGDGTFREAIAEWTDHTTQFSMGVDVADLNNDLLPDLYSTDMLPFDEDVYLRSGGEDTDQIKRIKDDLGFENQFARNHLQINTGQGGFQDLALQTRTFATDWSWAVLLQDFDNDGRKDIFVSNGIYQRPNDLDYIKFLNSEAVAQYREDDLERTQKLIEKLPSQPLRNVLFRQTDDLQFTSMAESGVGEPSFANGAAYADLDGDGSLEIVVNNIDAAAAILRVRSAATANYLVVDLKDPDGKTTNGAKVYAYADGQTLYQEQQSVKGFQSASSHRLHFGLGAAKSVDSLVVIWPDYTRQVMTAVEANSSLTITKEASGALWVPNPSTNLATDFDVLPLRHTENDFNDDERENLIPELLSREGPAVLYEDLDGDGIEDLLIGGAHNTAASLLRGKADGSFENLEVADFTTDARYEDVRAATIDFDGDGDRDLYIASGGSGGKELDKVLEDRLYLNNGGMDFRRIPLSLPHTNGSALAVADFDGDGFEDIFVGARSIPGSYGLSPYSFVLKNRGGGGVDIAYQERFGMITDARWIDLEGDGDLDLVMCGDWMPVTILENDGQGSLTEMLDEARLPQRSGFWNTLEFVDLNADGRLDILVGNAGSNSLLTATTENPLKLYLGDFDENGAVDPIIFFHYFGRYMPLGSKDRYVTQLPGLRKRFATYADFSTVSSFAELFPEGAAQLVETKEVNELRSLLFLSTENGYRAEALPARAQTATIQDFLVDEEARSVYFLTGNQTLTAVQGNAAYSKLGLMTALDPPTGAFKNDRWLNFPRKIDARKIVSLRDGKGLIVTNDGYLYLVEL